MLILQDISYAHPNKDVLLNHINITVNRHDKIALIGDNGVGKSTLLKIIARELNHTGGQINADSSPYYVPQIFGQFDHLTIGQAMKVEEKIRAFYEILNGNLAEENYTLLNDDWTIEERCTEVLNSWQLGELDLSQKLGTLSGGQKTRVFLAGMLIHQPELILMDEPSNHLDLQAREQLYDFIRTTSSTLMIVSHDRVLLNLLSTVCELSQNGITVYGGNFDFYKTQKQIATNALNEDLHSKEKALRKAREKERETAERQQKLDNRGQKKQEKSGVARIMMNTLRNNAENSTSKLKSAHSSKISGITQDLQELRSALPEINKMKFGFDHSDLHKGKILFTATNMNFGYGNTLIWKENIGFQITSGERIALKGKNGSGKTTLIHLILGKLEPQTGTVYRANNQVIYIDQDYSLVDNRLNVYEQAEQFNSSALQEHEVKIRLNRFLFTKSDWDKNCGALSGGEKMRLILCCLTISQQAPDIIVLDEPTNNLDIQNTEILTSAIHEYQGTLVVVSHDNSFLKQIDIERCIELVSRND